MVFQREYWERKDLKKRRHPENEIVKSYVIPKLREIRKIIPIARGIKLLDVGAGNGFFTYYFDKVCDTTAVDYSEKMIAMNPVKKKFVMDANSLEYEDNSFDVVFCRGLLHHVDDIDRVVKEMRRVSSKYVVIVEPNRNNPLMFAFSALVREEWKALRFSLAFLRKIVARNRLHIIDSFSFGMTVPNKAHISLLPFLKLFDFRYPMGMTNILVTQKKL